MALPASTDKVTWRHVRDIKRVPTLSCRRSNGNVSTIQYNTMERFYCSVLQFKIRWTVCQNVSIKANKCPKLAIWQIGNLAKGRIGDLSPLAAANGFFRPWFPYSTWFLGPTRVSPSKRHFDRFSRFCTVP